MPNPVLTEEQKLRLETAKDILRVQLSSPAYKPGIKNSDFVPDKTGAFIEVDGMYINYNPKNQAHQGRKRYDVASIEAVFVRDAYTFADALIAKAKE